MEARVEEQLPHKQVLHHTRHLTEALGEAEGTAGKRLNEARLVFLTIQTNNECFLTALQDFVSIPNDYTGDERCGTAVLEQVHHQDA